jgi:hypothetical protein
MRPGSALAHGVLTAREYMDMRAPGVAPTKESGMPKAWSSKDERQYEHIKQSEKSRGSKRAKEIAARTVNKKRRQEGRTKKSRSSSHKSSSRRSSRKS